MSQEPVTTLTPKTPGIFILINEAAKQLFIGRSTNLYMRHAHLRTPTGTAIYDFSSPDWVFRVVVSSEHLTAEKLKLAKAETIKKISQHPAYAGYTILNVNNTGEKQDRSHRMKSKVVFTDENGIEHEMPYSEAASKLGITEKTLQNRLAARRRKGQYNVQFQDLYDTRRGK